MKLRELFEKLGIDPESEDTVLTIRVNGYDKESFDEVPVLDFKVASIGVHLDNHDTCEIVIYP